MPKASSPAPLTVRAHPTSPIPPIFSDTSEKLAGARRLDHGYCSVADGLCELRIERHEKVQTFAGVSVNDGEQRRVHQIKVRLIDCHLPGIRGVQTSQTVALDRAPALG